MVNGKEMAVHVCRIAKYENMYLLTEDEVREQVVRSTKGFQIDKVVDSRWNNTKREYELLCSWLGLERSDDSWLNLEEVMSTSPDLLDRYLLKAELNSTVKALLKKRDLLWYSVVLGGSVADCRLAGRGFERTPMDMRLWTLPSESV